VCIPPKFHNNQLNPIIHLKVYVFWIFYKITSIRG
jgi:hypothetical protein